MNIKGSKKIIVTGGAGFIGSALVRFLLENTHNTVLNIDKLSYAGDLKSLEAVENKATYSFKKIDICDLKSIKKIILDFNPDIIMHLAAESHVDNSISSPSDFINTNIIGTFNLLESSRALINLKKNDNFLFHHISTDEVFGDLAEKHDFFTENTPYMPSSPYSASKASSDHLVRAWGRTFNLPFVITNCSNNYGPFQYPEKLIPKVIINAIEGKEIPVFGSGNQIRDWLYVDDHVRGLYKVALSGSIGESYNLGGANEKTNLSIINTILNILNDLSVDKPKGIKDFSELIRFVSDRPGHDKRYAINADKIHTKLGWEPVETFDSGILKTVNWYLENQNWIKYILQKNSIDK